MNLTPELKSQIDSMTYRQLLERWRNGPLGDEMFQGESGNYWAKRMADLRSQPGGDAQHTAASKSIGWDG